MDELANDLFSTLKEIEGRLDSTTVDEIKNRIRPFLTTIVCPNFDPGVFLYRARRFDSSFNKQSDIRLSDLIYPPLTIAKWGRLNREGQSVFYCSMHKQSVFFEIPELKKGDEIILTFWKTKERMLLNNIGYTEHVFRLLGAKREVPNWGSLPKEKDITRETVTLPRRPMNVAQVDGYDAGNILGQYFARPVKSEDVSAYKLTTAIGELYLQEIIGQEQQFAGILYPSVRMWANGDNIALLPSFVDKHLQFRKAIHVRIDNCEETAFSVNYLDTAITFDGDGKLAWLGRQLNWVLNRNFQKARFVVTKGCDDNGDYQIGKDGQPCHWEAFDIDTGEKILEQ